MILSFDDNVEKGDDDDNQRPQQSINVSGMNGTSTGASRAYQIILRKFLSRHFTGINTILQGLFHSNDFFPPYHMKIKQGFDMQQIPLPAHLNIQHAYIEIEPKQ